MNVKDKKHYTPLHAAAAGGQCHAVGQTTAGIRCPIWYIRKADPSLYYGSLSVRYNHLFVSSY